MQLIEIDKDRYRRHLNRLIIGCIIIFATGSLAIAQALIATFPDESGSHFHWNLLGVVITALAITWLLNKYRNHDYMQEVSYVWELKQTLNKINRKMAKLKAAAGEGNVKALQALNFSYAGSRLLWNLDDNTIIMDELAIQQAELDALARQYNVILNADNFDVRDLQDF